MCKQIFRGIKNSLVYGPYYSMLPFCVILRKDIQNHSCMFGSLKCWTAYRGDTASAGRRQAYTCRNLKQHLILLHILILGCNANLPCTQRPHCNLNTAHQDLVLHLRL